MNYKLFLSIHIALFVIYLNLFPSVISAEEKTENKSLGWNYLLPINALENAKKKVTLAINVPDTFKPVGNVSLEADPTALIEFIAKEDENVKNWSKIITIKSHPKLALKSNKKYLDLMVEGFKKYATNVNIIESKDQKEEGYEDGHRIIAYTHKNRNEMVYIYSASGPEDTAMVQYAIVINAENTLSKAKEILEKFMTENVTKI